MQDGHQILLEDRLEIDQQVAAADQIHPGKRRISGDVVPGEHAHVADRLGDTVLAVDLVEVAPQPLRRDVVGDALGIETQAGTLDAYGIQIGREDLYRPDAPHVRHEFRNHDTERIGFFSRRAPDDPHAEGIARRALLRELRKQPGVEQLKRLRITEKRRDVDENILKQRFHLRRRVTQVFDVSTQRIDLVQHHATRDAAVQRRHLVVLEIDSHRLMQQVQHPRELPVGGRRVHERRFQRDVGVSRDFGEPLPNGGWRQHKIHRAGQRRAARHPLVRGRLVLRERDAAGRLDLVQPQRAVAARPRQDDRDRLVPLRLRQRLEEHVDRMMLAAPRAPRQQLERSALHHHVAVGRDHVDVIGLHRRFGRHFIDGHSRGAREDLGEMTRVRGRQVRHEDERHARVGRRRCQQMCERLEAAG